MSRLARASALGEHGCFLSIIADHKPAARLALALPYPGRKGERTQYRLRVRGANFLIE